MKKKVLITLLTLTMTAAMITGCGNKPSQSQAAETNQESTVEVSEESIPEASDEVTSSTEETDKESEQTPSVEPTPAPTEEPQESSAETSQENEISSNEAQAAETPKPISEPIAESSSAVQPETTPEATPAPTETPIPVEQPLASEYDVTAMSTTMYVKNTVNLRQGPGSNYAKVGSLNKGDQVTVTGQAANGWYQLDSGAFVSNKYLDSTTPATTVATVPEATVLPTDQTGVTTLTLTAAESFGGTSTEFIDYLNQQRTAAGLGTLTWDNEIAALAQQRAQAIVGDFSHNGCPSGYGEIIQDNTGSTYVDWFNSWNTSTTGHKENMFRDDYATAGCGYYYNSTNRRYYVVALFKQRERTQEELAEITNPDNMVQIGENAYIDKGSYDALINAGIDPSAQPDDEALKRQEELDRLAEEGLIEVPSLD